ncbi:MAG: hypothetical protein C5B49_01430, partial [Bdellovibrio sp.]
MVKSSVPSSGDLSCFLEVSSTLNLSRAGERLGMTQPSVTLAIQRLEQCVGTQLFIRSRKGVSLTQAGKQLVSHARDLVLRWDAVKRQALASADEVQGHYKIGCHSSVAKYSLPRVLPRLLHEHPRLEVILQHDLSRKITERVIAMDIDLGIVINPVRHPDLVMRRLCRDEVTLWAGPDARPAHKPRQEDFILVCDPDLIQSQVLMKKMAKSGFRFRRILPTSSLELIVELVAEGCGLGIIPGRVVGGFKDCKLRKIAGAPVVTDSIELIYRVENKHLKSLQVISEALSDGIGNSNNGKSNNRAAIGTHPFLAVLLVFSLLIVSVQQAWSSDSKARPVES